MQYNHIPLGVQTLQSYDCWANIQNPMIDYLKLHVDNISLINRLANNKNLQKSKTKKGYSCYHLDKSIQLEFRKAYENHEFIGFGHLWIKIRLHNYFNGGLHNGNDFTVLNVMKTLDEVLSKLGIKSNQYDLLKLVNIEFGVNFLTPYNYSDVINGFLFYKKKSFNKPLPNAPYYRTTYQQQTPRIYKEIKVYAKGLQMQNKGIEDVSMNTIRFEIKSNQSKNIKKYGLSTAKDLFKPEVYETLKNEIIKEFDLVLWCDINPDLRNTKPHQKKQLKKYSKRKFWNSIINENSFSYHRNKYLKFLKLKSKVFISIRNSLIDKLEELNYLINSTSNNNDYFYHIPPHARMIKVENAKFNDEINKRCTVTGLDISMQKEVSKFLCVGGLRYYYEYDKKTFLWLKQRFLTEDKTHEPLELQFYYIAHNIRNIESNKRHSYLRRLENNSNPNQISIFSNL